jgi:maltose alpha-D-glucosyltransferase/alpha-amylase
MTDSDQVRSGVEYTAPHVPSLYTNTPSITDLWYKNAIIYAIDVGTFMDSNGDGVGDFDGLTSRLDYLAGLGVSCLWLLPFYPSSHRDNGYDVTDYLSVDPRHGTVADFTEFLHQARKRGLRVLTDLVVNHTSDQHPWFQAARTDQQSPYHDYYIWTDQPPKHSDEKNIFPTEESGVWTYDEAAKAYYYHKFYHFEPDLNNAHPAVRAEVRKIMGFWLALGCSGFRVDAAPHMIEQMSVAGTTLDDPHELLRDMRDFLSVRRGDGVFIAETDVEPDKLATFFGDGDEMHLLFNFLLDNYLFLAFVREQAEPIARALRMLPEKPRVSQWANFLRNLDELDLERLSEDERKEVLAALAPGENMRIYGRGIRRRLAPMLGGDRHRLELAYSLLFTLPGTPVLIYGDEIGMGDNLALDERNSVRTPMQWSPEQNGGFSTARLDQLVRPVIADGEYSYQHVNVTDQRRDPLSLFNWMGRAIALRRETPEFGWGNYHIIETDQPAVFAHTCTWENRAVLAIHNLSGRACEVTLNRKGNASEQIIELFGNRKYEPLNNGVHTLQLDEYGYRWFRIANKDH